MPAISTAILDCVVYLYPDEKSAQRGDKAGGSGCVVAISTSHKPFPMGFLYVVTNSHVILEGKCSTLRFNAKKGGGFRIIHDTHKGWIHHPYGDDIAVLPCSLEYGDYNVKAIPIHSFITKEDLVEYHIGPGDETLMVGRFVNHEGKVKNLPCVRFGQISMLPYELIRTRRGLLQEAFLVECRSLPGYSGSPVFLAPLPSTLETRTKLPPPLFLGIDMGHITDERAVLNKSELRKGNRVPVDANWTVETNTGMSLVIPAWKIKEVLEVDELVKSREEMLAELERQKQGSPVAFDVMQPENPVMTKSDFEDTLKKVSRKKSSRA